MTKFENAILRLSLASVWLLTALVSQFFYPEQDSLAMLAGVGLHGQFAQIALYGAVLLDAILGLATLCWPSVLLWRVQAILILGYSVVIAMFLPQFLIHPFGPILKNLPILALLWLLARHPVSPSSQSTENGEK